MSMVQISACNTIILSICFLRFPFSAMISRLFTQPLNCYNTYLREKNVICTVFEIKYLENLVNKTPDTSMTMCQSPTLATNNSLDIIRALLEMITNFNNRSKSELHAK